ncbi:MAG: heme exporter protein CcmB [Candidatus Methylomirabilales bacterium]
MSLLLLAGQVLRKDLRIEARSREGVNTILFFSALVVFLLRFALGPTEAQVRQGAPGLLWFAFILTGLWGMTRTFQVEQENDCLESLRLCPGDLGGLYLGKVLVGCCLMGVAELMILTMFGLFFHLDLWPAVTRLIPVLGLGTLGFVAIGTLFAAITAHLKAREVLLPLLLFPLVLPVLLAASRLTELALAGEALGAEAHWLRLLVVFDLVFVVLGYLTFPFVMED